MLHKVWSGGAMVLGKLPVPGRPTIRTIVGQWPASLAGAPVAQWVKRWPTDLADRVRSSLEVKSSQP